MKIHFTFQIANENTFYFSIILSFFSFASSRVLNRNGAYIDSFIFLLVEVFNFSLLNIIKYIVKGRILKIGNIYQVK